MQVGAVATIAFQTILHISYFAQMRFAYFCFSACSKSTTLINLSVERYAYKYLFDREKEAPRIGLALLDM